MKRLNRALLLAGAALALTLGTGTALAQGRGDFDPAEFQKRMMDRYREQLEVTNDDEWKIIEPRVTKVSEARRDVTAGGFGRGGFGGGRRGGGGNDQGGDTARRNPFGGTPMPEQEALQKAIEAKAPADEIKTKLAKYREARKVKEANLAKAQDELRKVLSVRQEAIASVSGLL